MARVESICQTCGFVATFETDPGSEQVALPAVAGAMPTNRCPMCMAHNWSVIPGATETTEAGV